MHIQKAMRTVKSLRCALLLIAIFTLNSITTVTGSDQPKPPPDPVTVDRHISSAHREAHGALIEKVMTLVLEKAVFFNEDEARKTGPLNFQDVVNLKKQLNYKLSDDSTSDEEILKILESVIQFSPHPSHPYMLDKRVSGLDPYALAGDWLAATMSNLVVKYQISPIWTLMELEMIKKFSDLIGWPKAGDGTPTPGAGVSNSMALALSLGRKYPNFKEQGLFGRQKQPVIFLSHHASYGYEKIAAYQGIAAKNVIKIKVDAKGRMDVEDLKAKIATAKEHPQNELVMVVGTAGTQVLGQIDPLDQIGDVCSQNDIWFHVDAEKAGGYLFLKEEGALKGITMAHSVTIGTWLLSTPYVTTFLMVKDATLMHKTFGLHAPYVWTGLDLYDTNVDTGDHTIQTSRRPEISKFFFMWRGRGRNGLISHIEKVRGNRDYFVQKIKEKSTVLVSIVEESDLPLVSFYIVPSGGSREDHEALSKASERIQKSLLEKNLMVVTLSWLPEEESGTIPKHPKFFITVSLTNSVLEHADIDYIISVLEDVANDKPPTATPPSLNADGKPFVNSPIRALHEKFLKDVFDIFYQEGLFFKRSEPSSNFMQPEPLTRKFDFRLSDMPTTHPELLEDFRKVIKYSPHWGHPYFIYQLAAALDPFTLVADYVASALNTPMINYRDSPVFTILEKNLLKRFRARIFGKEDGDGIITDGGSMANQVAIGLAKAYQKNKHGDLRVNGITGNKKLVIFISEDGHYSTRKGAIVQSLGSEQVVNVGANTNGKMEPQELKKEIDAAVTKGDIPLMVVVTTGTTVYGAIDPVEEIIKICKQYQIWCHIDGMFGGMLHMSDTHRGKLEGVHEADSFGVDLHKMMGSTMVSTAIITAHKGIFRDAFEVKSTSDFIDEADDKLSTGGKHWQVDKRNNMFKFWLLWKGKGRTGLGRHIETVMSNVEYMMKEINARKDRGYLPAQEKFEVTNVCFYYIPISMRSIEVDSEEWKVKMAKISFEIEKQVWRNRIINIVSQNRRSKMVNTGTFLKFIMMGSAMTQPDILYILDIIEYVGKNLDPATLPDPAKVRGSSRAYRFEPFGNQPIESESESLQTIHSFRPESEGHPHPGLQGPGSDLDMSSSGSTGPSTDNPDSGTGPGPGNGNNYPATTVCKKLKNWPRIAFDRAQKKRDQIIRGRSASKRRTTSKHRARNPRSLFAASSNTSPLRHAK